MVHSIHYNLSEQNGLDTFPHLIKVIHKQRMIVLEIIQKLCWMINIPVEGVRIWMKIYFMPIQDESTTPLPLQVQK